MNTKNKIKPMTRQEAKLGNTYYTDGVDMNCLPVVCKVKLIKFINETEYGYDCVIESDKILIKTKLSELRTTKS
jgi:hypothetical protein